MKDQCYQFLKNQIGKASIVGFGSYGQVKIARNTQTNQIVAIKLIHGKNAKQEIDVHHKLNHPNIIKLINYYYEKDRNITYMVLQYAQNGSLNEKIKFGLGQLSKQLINKYFKDICEAIRYLHRNNYMHRDIKPQNILITKDNVAKLCDFGFAAIFEARTTMCGTFEYMAPQMIKKKHYNYKIDIWALGILLFEMIQGIAPFRGDKGQEVLAQMKKPIKFSSRFDSLQIDLIKKILRVNAQNRPTMDQILEHPYFKQLKQQEILNNSKLLNQNFDNKVNKIQLNVPTIKDKFNSSKEQLTQFFKNSQFRPNPLIDKLKPPFSINAIKSQNIVNNNSENNLINSSFKNKNIISSTKQDQFHPQKQSKKFTSNFVGIFSPQNQKKTLSPANSKTQVKQDKNNDFNLKNQQKKVFTSNWIPKNISDQSKNSLLNKNQNQRVQVNKKTSITGKNENGTGNSQFSFLNKSFKDLKRISLVQDLSFQKIEKNNHIKTEPQVESTSIFQPCGRKNTNISISNVNSSFNQSNGRTAVQYQSPNSSFNIYDQNKQNIGTRIQGNGESKILQSQVVNFERPVTKHLNMSILKQPSK